MVVVFLFTFSKHECNNTSAKPVYEFYEYLKQKNNDKRQILACFLGRIPFPIKIIHSTMLTLQKQYIEMTQCRLIYMNPAVSTPIMILKYVSPPSLVELNKVTGICLC